MKYPIGIQDFRVLREGGNVYVDKTQHIHRLVSSGKYYFLSRPRRFGKSLLLSTMTELYRGSRELFSGLWIENHWDWEANRRPVIHLKFARFKYRDNPLQAAIWNGLEEEAERLGVSLAKGSFVNPLEDLIRKAYRQHERKVVLLIDEYDKPIIDYLDDPDQAEQNRDTLKWLYAILKDSDPYLELVFITGVSAFSKVSIFSDLNNLYNLSLSARAEQLTGITQTELEHYFTAPLEQIAAARHLSLTGLTGKLKTWYNGYSWTGGDKVYNPFSLLSFLAGGQFRNFWFETGTPTFLLKELYKQRYYDLEGQQASEFILNEFNLRQLHPVSVLFQTGYLTIVEPPDVTGLYTLSYPNLEVKSAFQERLLNVYTADRRQEAAIRISRLLQALERKDLESVITIINATFAELPYEHWQQADEHFFHALIHLTFSLLGVYIHFEVHTAKGRCDAIVQTDRYLYAFEFKLDRSAAEALRQIAEREYLTPYADSPKEKIAVGVRFSSRDKQVAEWAAEGVD